MRSRALIAVVLLSLCCAAFAQRSATARFNSRGIRGYVTFTEEGDRNVRVVANLEGLRGRHNWHVHLYPVDQSLEPTVQCLGTQVGGHYNPFMVDVNAPNYVTNCQGNQTLCEVGDLENKFGSLPEDGQLEGVDMSGQLELTGRYSIVGRPLIIHQSDTDPAHLECATIRLNDEMQGAELLLLQATFISPIAGTIYMRQVERENVEIFGKLYWVNDAASTVEHNWHIHEEQPGEEYRFAECNITAGGNVGPHYDPTGNGPTSRAGYSTECTQDTPDGCEAGDLTGKHARINIPARPDPYTNGAFFFTDSFLNLTDVVGRSIVVHVPNGGGPALACAPLVLSENITVMSSATGFIRVSQSSPFEDTIIHTFSEVLGGAVRTLPSSNVTILSSALSPPNTECRGDLFTPYAPIDEGGMPTPDSYPLGDWFNRYSNSLVPSNSFQVFDVPLYGPNTVLGKTARVTSGTSRYCSFLSNKFSPTGDDVIRARAVFSGSTFGPIEGVIYFSQRNFGEGILGNTQVLVDIYYAAPNLNTTGHNWHVHQTPPSGPNCVDSIGPHYNPFSVSLGTLGGDGDSASVNSDYGDDCSPTYPLRCESGDLSGKHGPLRISSDGATRQTFSYIDPNIQLTGNTTIIGRSIGLHNIDGPLFDCGEVTEVYPSGRFFNVVFTAGEMLRTDFAAALTQGTEVDPVNVIIASQLVTPLQFGIECVNVTVAILGTSQQAADSYYEMIDASNNIDDFRCGATTMMVAPMLMVVSLLIAFFSK